MTSQIRDAHKRRIGADQDALDGLSARLAHVERRRSAAEAALAAARAKLDDLACEELLLRPLVDAATHSLAQSRAMSLRAFLSTFPDDLLSYVFEHLAVLADAQWQAFGNGQYNAERARQPFVVASVCSRWRRVALNSPRLWSYIGVPSLDDELVIAQSSRVHLLLLRSRAAPVDILLRFEDLSLENSDDNDPLFALAVRGIFRELSAHADRWRRVEAWMPSMPDRDVLDVFRGPMPLLEQLSLTGPLDGNWRDEPQEGFFPYCPRLRDLDLWETGMCCAPHHMGFPSLLSLKIWQEQSHDHIARLIRLGQDTLEALVLDVSCDETPTAALVFPRLQSLTLRNRPYLFRPAAPPILIAPHLRSLTLYSHIIQSDITDLMQQLSETVTELSLQGHFTTEQLFPLRPLRKISHLHVLVDTCISVGVASQIDDAVLIQLATAEPCIWPCLTHIVISDGGIVPKSGHGMLQLLAARNACVGYSSSSAPEDSERAKKLEDVILDYEGVPPWLLSEVRRLLAL